MPNGACPFWVCLMRPAMSHQTVAVCRPAKLPSCQSAKPLQEWGGMLKWYDATTE
jgi:hypothetical protein